MAIDAQVAYAVVMHDADPLVDVSTVYGVVMHSAVDTQSTVFSAYGVVMHNQPEEQMDVFSAYGVVMHDESAAPSGGSGAIFNAQGDAQFMPDAVQDGQDTRFNKTVDQAKFFGPSE